MLDDASHRVQCPWCFEVLEIWIDPMSRGRMSRDCEVCCRPWTVFVERGHDQSGLLTKSGRAASGPRRARRAVGFAPKSIMRACRVQESGRPRREGA